jgi:hypothetical protein
MTQRDPLSGFQVAALRSLDAPEMGMATSGPAGQEEAIADVAPKKQAVDANIWSSGNRFLRGRRIQ